MGSARPFLLLYYWWLRGRRTNTGKLLAQGVRAGAGPGLGRHMSRFQIHFEGNIDWTFLGPTTSG